MACPGIRNLVVGGAIMACAGGAWMGLRAQPPNATDTAAVQVVIDREALRLIDPRTLQVPLQLAAVRSVELTAAADGFVQTVRIQSGQSIAAQDEAIRIEGREEQLLVERARAGVRAAEVEVRSAREATGSPLAGELAAARLEIAKADVELANLRLERTVVRAPFEGRILRVHTTPGAYVRAGEPLATLADTQRLQVEIPIDRGTTKPGQAVEIRIEDAAVQGRVGEILPLAERFEPLRTVLHSVASATVLVDNADGRFHVGQTVYAPLVPRQPVAEIRTSSLTNLPDGGRRVQVLRGDTVRDVEVQLLGPVGSDRMYVSGAFADGDEIVLEASQTLADGTRVQPATPAASVAGRSAAETRPVPRDSGQRPPLERSRF